MFLELRIPWLGSEVKTKTNRGDGCPVAEDDKVHFAMHALKIICALEPDVMVCMHKPAIGTTIPFIVSLAYGQDQIRLGYCQDQNVNPPIILAGKKDEGLTLFSFSDRISALLDSSDWLWARASFHVRLLLVRRAWLLALWARMLALPFLVELLSFLDLGRECVSGFLQLLFSFLCVILDELVSFFSFQEASHLDVSDKVAFGLLLFSSPPPGLHDDVVFVAYSHPDELDAFVLVVAYAESEGGFILEKEDIPEDAELFASVKPAQAFPVHSAFCAEEVCFHDFHSVGHSSSAVPDAGARPIEDEIGSEQNSGDGDDDGSFAFPRRWLVVLCGWVHGCLLFFQGLTRTLGLR
jgi:hypothetical protein